MHCCLQHVASVNIDYYQPSRDVQEQFDTFYATVFQLLDQFSFRRLRFSSDADIVRLTNARIFIIIIIIILSGACYYDDLTRPGLRQP